MKNEVEVSDLFTVVIITMLQLALLLCVIR
jgi:hypothetical protein